MRRFLRIYSRRRETARLHAASFSRYCLLSVVERKRALFSCPVKCALRSPPLLPCLSARMGVPVHVCVHMCTAALQRATLPECERLFFRSLILLSVSFTSVRRSSVLCTAMRCKAVVETCMRAIVLFYHSIGRCSLPFDVVSLSFLLAALFQLRLRRLAREGRR